MEKVLEIFFELRDLLDGIEWWWGVIVYPFVKGFYEKTNERKEFQKTFSFPWPKNEQEIGATKHSAIQTLTMLEALVAALDAHAGSFSEDMFVQDSMKKMLEDLQTELEKRKKTLKNAKKLLSKAGYGDFIEGLPDVEDEEAEFDDDEEEDEDEDYEDEEEFSDDED